MYANIEWGKKKIQLKDDESDRGQQRMRQDVECGNNRRASQVMTSSSSARGTSVGDTISAFGQQYQPAEVYHPSIHRHNNRWSAGRPHTSSLFGAGCFFLGEASTMRWCTTIDLSDRPPIGEKYRINQNALFKKIRSNASMHGHSQ